MSTEDRVAERLLDMERSARAIQDWYEQELYRSWLDHERRHRSIVRFSVVSLAALVISLLAHVWRSL